MRFPVALTAFASVLAISHVVQAETIVPRPSYKTATKNQRTGGAMIKPTEECNEAIRNLCLSKVTENDVDECKTLGPLTEKKECMEKKSGGAFALEYCQNEHIDELIASGCHHLRCKKLCLDKCQCRLMPIDYSDLMCWSECYERHPGKFAELQCSRPPLSNMPQQATAKRTKSHHP